jgi:MYXO-CTERM domain-containing protein
VGPTTVDGGVGGLSINNAGQVVFIWDDAMDVETLFRACDASDIPNTTDIVAAVNDPIDVDGDGMADGTLEDFNPGDPSLWLAEDGWLYANVDLDVGNGNEQAIVQLDVACCGDGDVGGAEDCDDMGESATCNADCTSVTCGDEIVNTTAGEECDEGGAESLSCDDDCTLPMCGDGTLNTTAGEDCDDGGESAACDSDCTAAECGDGLLNATAGEQCEDGNRENGDGCSSDCQLEGAGTGGGGTGGSGTGGSGTGGTGTGSGTGGAGTGGDTGGSEAFDVEADGGCGCEIPGRRDSRNNPWGLVGLALAGALGVSRRRRRR